MSTVDDQVSDDGLSEMDAGAEVATATRVGHKSTTEPEAGVEDNNSDSGRSDHSVLLR
jgi:hypothetical protein